MVDKNHSPTELAATFWFMCRFTLVAIIISIFAARFDTVIGEVLISAFKAEIHFLDGTYNIDKIYLDYEGADKVVRMVVRQVRYIVINGQAFAPHPLGRANASTLLGNAIFPATLLMAITFAWQAQNWLTYLRRAILLVPALIIILAVDVPLVLWGSIWRLHFDAIAPNQFSLLLSWCDFLQNGGRMIVPLVLGVVLVEISNEKTRFKSMLQQLRPEYNK